MFLGFSVETRKTPQFKKFRISTVSIFLAIWDYINIETLKRYKEMQVEMTLEQISEIEADYLALNEEFDIASDFDSPEYLIEDEEDDEDYEF